MSSSGFGFGADNYGRDRTDKNIRQLKGESVIDNPDDYIVVDIETTGLMNCDIIEVSALKIENSYISDKFVSLLKPKWFDRLDPFITQLTGITSDMVSNAPDEEEVLMNFSDFVADSVLVGHNVHFDVNNLYDKMMYLFGMPLTNNMIDTLRLSRKLLPNLDHHRLSDVAFRLNISYSGAHRAEKDCEITYQCFETFKTMAIEEHGSFERFKASFNRYKKYPSIKISDIKPSVGVIDESSEFFNKIIVLTGEFNELSKREAMQAVVDMGGILRSAVSSKTDILIVGSQRSSLTGAGRLSAKERVARDLLAQGKEIQIMDEDEFMRTLAKPAD